MSKLEEIKKGVEEALTPYIINRTLYAHLDYLGIKKPQYIALKKSKNLNYDTAVFWVEKLNLQVDLSYSVRLFYAVEFNNPNQVATKLVVHASTVHMLRKGKAKPRLDLLDKINAL